MRTFAAVVVALALAFALPPSATAKGKPHVLVGKWRVVAGEARGQRRPVPAGIEITVEFVTGGKFVGITTAGGKTQQEEGTWSADGAKLTTVVKGKSETVGFEVKGKELRLTAEAGQVLVFERSTP